ncbi:hypothetical protein KI387_032467 [Taxus chinensis]|uniref:Pre-mRNA-processing factor 39 n=1 Tax=Taxus chinensis TaxID=29808 RepID=A0AA38BPE0_TAXCH|nr:hypothetical protein KI387_032467 [Taxus chinensis]
MLPGLAPPTLPYPLDTYPVWIHPGYGTDTSWVCPGTPGQCTVLPLVRVGYIPAGAVLHQVRPGYILASLGLSNNGPSYLVLGYTDPPVQVRSSVWLGLGMSQPVLSSLRFSPGTSWQSGSVQQCTQGGIYMCWLGLISLVRVGYVPARPVLPQVQPGYILAVWDYQAPPAMDYTSTENSGLSDASKYVPDHESALPQRSPAVEYAADGAVLTDEVSVPPVAYGTEDATALSGGNDGITHQDPVIEQGPPPPAFGMEDSSGFSDGNKIITGLDTHMEQVTQSSVYEGTDAPVNYDMNKYMGDQLPVTNQEAVSMPDINQYNSAEHHADDNGNIVTVENKEHEQPQYEEPQVAISTEEERLWGTVRVNSADFTAWTSLIQETEKTAEDYLPKIRKVYDAFLAEFPLCYGYWKKYADHEARSGSAEKIIEVYERAVQAVTYSVDIWMHYAIFAMSTYEDPDIIRRLFERGLSYVGTDYLSYPLWDKYIEYEYSQQEWSHLAQIYTRILQIPIQQLDRYFSSFKELAASRPLLELRTVEENAAVSEAAAVLAGREGVNRTGDGEEEAPKPESATLSEADELEKYIAVREAMYKAAKEMDAKIRDFENAIRRPYFHVKPLDDVQLGNWHHYLDFVEKSNDFDRMVKVYERCLIACANYPEYWVRYVQCMQAAGSMEVANDALARATQIFVKRQPDIHIFAARFKEQLGDTIGARAEYQLLSSEIAPGLLDSVIKHVNMEHRLGNLEAASSVFEIAIAAEKSKEHSQSLPLLFIQYSRYLQLVEGNAERAREMMTIRLFVDL